MAGGRNDLSPLFERKHKTRQPRRKKRLGAELFADQLVFARSGTVRTVLALVIVAALGTGGFVAWRLVDGTPLNQVSLPLAVAVMAGAIAGMLWVTRLRIAVHAGGLYLRWFPDPYGVSAVVFWNEIRSVEPFEADPRRTRGLTADHGPDWRTYAVGRADHWLTIRLNDDYQLFVACRHPDELIDAIEQQAEADAAKRDAT